MRLITSLIAMAMAVAGMSAQEPEQSIVNHINNSGSVTVDVPQGLMDRLSYDNSGKTSTSTDADATTKTTRPRNSVGYRVEIFADNNVRTAKGQAQSRRAAVMSRLSQYPAYLLFESPYWRVRVGDFATRAEAESALADIRRTFPSFSSDLRIVRSRIR